MSCHSRRRTNERKLSWHHFRSLLGESRRTFLVIDPPQVHVGEEIRPLITELGAGLIRGLLLIHRPFARVLHRQGRCDDQHFLQALLILGCQNHPPNPRIDRQPGQQPSGLRQLIGFIDGPQLMQRLISIANLPIIRRIEERETADVAQSERLHLKDHAGQVGPQYLRVREWPADRVILLRIQANAHARAHAAAASLALIGAGLRDRFHRQPLHLRSRRIPADPRLPRINHISNPRHGQRRLGHVRRQDQPPSVMRLEHPHLFLGRQPSVQRQHFGHAPDDACAVPRPSREFPAHR